MIAVQTDNADRRRHRRVHLHAEEPRQVDPFHGDLERRRLRPRRHRDGGRQGEVRQRPAFRARASATGAGGSAAPPPSLVCGRTLSGQGDGGWSRCFDAAVSGQFHSVRSAVRQHRGLHCQSRHRPRRCGDDDRLWTALPSADPGATLRSSELLLLGQRAIQSGQRAILDDRSSPPCGTALTAEMRRRAEDQVQTRPPGALRKGCRRPPAPAPAVGSGARGDPRRPRRRAARRARLSFLVPAGPRQPRTTWLRLRTTACVAIEIKAPRGVIEDRNGTMLVDNRPGLAIGIRPMDVPKGGLSALAPRLSPPGPRAGQDDPRPGRQTVVAALRPRHHQARRAQGAGHLSLQRDQSFPGVEVQESYLRGYPLGDLAAPILGYLGPDRSPAAQAGQVQGRTCPTTRSARAASRPPTTAGSRATTAPRWSRSTPWGEPGRSAAGGSLPKPGDNLVLTLDARVQKAAENAIRSASSWRTSPATRKPARAPRSSSTPTAARSSPWPTTPATTRTGSPAASASPTKRLLQPQADDPLLDRAIAGEYPDRLDLQGGRHDRRPGDRCAQSVDDPVRRPDLLEPRRGVARLEPQRPRRRST